MIAATVQNLKSCLAVGQLPWIALVALLCRIAGIALVVLGIYMWTVQQNLN